MRANNGLVWASVPTLLLLLLLLLLQTTRSSAALAIGSTFNVSTETSTETSIFLHQVLWYNGQVHALSMVFDGTLQSYVLTRFNDDWSVQEQLTIQESADNSLMASCWLEAQMLYCPLQLQPSFYPQSAQSASLSAVDLLKWRLVSSWGQELPANEFYSTLSYSSVSSFAVMQNPAVAGCSLAPFVLPPRASSLGSLQRLSGFTQLSSGIGLPQQQQLLVCGVNASLDNLLALLDVTTLSTVVSVQDVSCRVVSFDNATSLLVLALDVDAGNNNTNVALLLVQVGASSLQVLAPPQQVAQNCSALSITSNSAYAFLVLECSRSNLLLQVSLADPKHVSVAGTYTLPSVFQLYMTSLYVQNTVNDETNEWLVTWMAPSNSFSENTIARFKFS